MEVYLENIGVLPRLGSIPCQGMEKRSVYGKVMESPLHPVLPRAVIQYYFRGSACQSPGVASVRFLIFIYLWGAGVEAEFLYVALAVLELALQKRLAWNSEIHLLLPLRCWD